MEEKVYVTIYAPILEKKIDIFIPISKKIYEIIYMIKLAVPELSFGYYMSHPPFLYRKIDGNEYDLNSYVYNSEIKNGTKLIIL